MSKYNKFVKDIGLMSIATFIVGLQGIILLPILTKYLGALNYGIWSQIKVTLGLISPLVYFGLNSALIRFLTGVEDKNKINKNISSTAIFILISGLLFSLFIFLISKPLSIFLVGNVNATIYFQIASGLILLKSITGIFSPILRIKEKYKIISFSKIFLSLSTILIIFYLLSLNLGISGVIFGFMLAEILFFLTLFIFSKNIFSFVKPSFKIIKKNLKYGFPLTFIPLFQWIFQVGDQYVLGYFQGAKIVGIYALAYSLAYVLRTIATPIYTILQTSITRAWNKNNIIEFKTYFQYSYKYLFLILIPATFGIIFLSEPIIRIISTSEFLDASKILPILIVGILLFTFTNLSNNLLTLEKKTKTIRNIFIFLAISNIILNLILVPLFSLYGAAIATLITFIISSIYSLSILKKHKMELMPLFFFKSILASSIMSGFILYARKMHIDPYMKIGIIIISSVLIYFTLMLLFRTFKKEEIHFLKNLIFNKIIH